MKDAVEMALWLKKWGYSPEQVQDFDPTPGTISTAMYYTGIHPLTMKKVEVTTDYREKQMQRALWQYKNPKNASLVREALRRAGREDLIGYTEGCLIRPAFGEGTKNRQISRTPKVPAHKRPLAAYKPKKSDKAGKPRANGIQSSKNYESRKPKKSGRK